jgi:hypothetical protein
MERGLKVFVKKTQEQETICYTYKVEMVVQVFAENLDQANDRLEQNGGYISSREVVLLNTNTVYESTDDEGSTEEPSETV